MKFIDSSYEIIEQEPGVLGVYKQIEKAARVSYKSEDKITEGSAQKMVDALIKNKHFACLEHGTIYLKFTDWVGEDVARYWYNSYSRCNEVLNNGKVEYYVTTNPRVIIENNWQKDLQHICEPTKHHERRITVKFTCSIGVGREITRHRAFSFMQESTRYCNYSKDKFGNELTFIIPQWIYDLQAEVASYNDTLTGLSREWLMDKKGNDLIDHLICLDRSASAWWDTLAIIEDNYNYLVTTDEGYTLKPQEARGILPLDLKSELVMTGFVDDWKHFFALRSHVAATGKPHPDIQILADELLNEFTERNYIAKDEIYTEQISKNNTLFS